MIANTCAVCAASPDLAAEVIAYEQAEGLRFNHARCGAPLEKWELDILASARD